MKSIDSNNIIVDSVPGENNSIPSESSEEKYFHSVTLDEDKCEGCTNCIKNCPTEAIRVHFGKATIKSERCIDCGECIRACPHNAKKAITDSMEELKRFRYNVALPAPSLYSQYRSARTRNHTLTALKRIGFDDVFEVALGAEAVSNATRQYLKNEAVVRPVISTACPAIIKLIQVKFPGLLDNLLKLQSPVEVAADMARREAVEKTGLKPEEIGLFFITPCAAKMQTKVTSMKSIASRNGGSNIDGMISFQDIYVPLRTAIKALPESEEEDLARASAFGVRWPNPGGESLALDLAKFISVDGVNDIAKLFETIENDDNLEGIEFIEALACKGGCLGGPLTVKNVYVAQLIMKNIRNEQEGRYRVPELPYIDVDYRDLMWDREPEHIPIHQLDPDMMVAMRKLGEMDSIEETLPNLDCGACGAPSCRSLAEDIVRGEAKITDCVFKLRERVRMLANEMFELEGMQPPTMNMDAGGEGGGSEKELGDGIESKRFGKIYSGESINWRNNL